MFDILTNRSINPRWEQNRTHPKRAVERRPLFETYVQPQKYWPYAQFEIVDKIEIDTYDNPRNALGHHLKTYKYNKALLDYSPKGRWSAYMRTLADQRYSHYSRNKADYRCSYLELVLYFEKAEDAMIFRFFDIR